MSRDGVAKLLWQGRIRNWIVSLALGIGAACMWGSADARADETGEDRIQRAEQLAEQAFEAYSQGDYPGAIKLYNEALQLAPSAILYYNMARIYETAVKDEELAMDYYRRCIAMPDAAPEVVARATARLAALRALKDQKPAPAPQPAPPVTIESKPAPPPPAPEPVPEPSSSAYTTAGLVSLGLGGTGLIFGSIFGSRALSKDKSAQDYCPTASTCVDQRGLDYAEEAHSAATISTVSFVAGGVLASVGIVLLVAAPSSPTEPADAPVALRLGAGSSHGGANLVLTGGF